MIDLLEFLQKFLPIEIAIITGIFIYQIVLFKKIAENFISLTSRQATLAETQTQYIQQRLDIVEKTLGISDKAFDLQQKRIKTLEELDKNRETEISRSQKSLEIAQAERQELERQYQEAVSNLNLREQQLQELRKAQHGLQQANRKEAIALFGYSLQTHLQIAIAHTDNLKHELPSDSGLEEQLEEILRAIEATSNVVETFTQG